MNSFSQPWIFFLCASIALGYAIGRVNYKGASLGSAAILFVGIGFGKMGATIPQDIGGIGLLIFLYAIGTDAGPSFLSALKGKGIQFSIVALCFTITAVITVVTCGTWFGIDPAGMAGIYAGSMVSSPALAGILDSVTSYQSVIITTAYSLLYPIGILMSILYTQWLISFDKSDIKKAEEELHQKSLFENPPIHVGCFEVYPRSISSVREIHNLFNVRITHIIPAGRKAVAPASALLKICPGDKIRLLGSETALKRVETFLHAKEANNTEFQEHIHHYQLVVTKKEACGSRIMHLAAKCHMDTLMFEHVRRNEVDIPLTPRTRLYMGDILHLSGDPRQIETLRRLLGDDPRQLQIADVMPVMLVISLGWLLGNIPIPLGVGKTFMVSSSAGVLLTAIFLSNIKKLGSIDFYLPSSSLFLLRETGLALFFAATGVHTGTSLTMDIIFQSGTIVLCGLITTILPMIVTWYFTKFILHMNYLYAIGSFAGARATASSFAIATSITKTPYVAAAYSIVFPVVTLLQIMSSKVVFTLGSLFISY